MAVSALIKFVQGVNVGVAGRALIGAAGAPVTASNANDASVKRWTWTILDAPPGSAVPVGTVTDGPLPALTFTPDVEHSYYVRLDVYDEAGRRSTDRRVFGVRNAAGRLRPPFSAPAGAVNFGGQLRGWTPELEDYLRAVDGEWVVSANGCVYTFAAEVTTTDATPAAITSPAPASLSPATRPMVVRADATFTAQKSNAGDQVTLTKTALFKVQAPNAVDQVGATASGTTIASGGAGAWAADLGTDGDVFIGTVTGQAATTIDWLVVLQLTAVGRRT